MGWCDESGKHEGWMQALFTDGTVSSGTSGGHGIYAEGYEYLPHDDNDTRTWGEIDPAYLRPYSDIVGWRMKCECGWAGMALPVEALDCDERFREPSEECEERDFLPAWRRHVAPDNAVSALERLYDDLREVEANIDAQVQTSRDAGVTWEQIGRALGMSRQGAQQRYGS